MQCLLGKGICTNCGQCDRCDLNPKKLCDSCGKCLEGYDYRGIRVDKIEIETGKEGL